MIKISKESDVLDEGFRGRVIAEIEGGENRRRKTEMYKRYEVLRDQTDTYTRNLLLAQLDTQSVQEMEYALTNISFTRKVVDKLARVYSNGVKRTLPKKKDTVNLERCARLAKFNSKMRKTNRFLKSMHNVTVYPRPIEVPSDDNDPEKKKFDLAVQVLSPYLYDVIENPHMPEEAWVYILSDFDPDQAVPSASLAPETEGRNRNTGSSLRPKRGDGVDQTIADAPADKNKPQPKNYIWWTKHFHFTTNEKGALVNKEREPINISGPEDEAVQNEIRALPFVNFATEQDGSFWALGGGDLTDGGIKNNSVLTHVIHIAITQGYGQLVITGKNLPRNIKVGPNHALRLETAEGEDGNATANYITANPPIAELLDLVRAYVALLLSTNNLSTSGVSATLEGGVSGVAGIALIIDKAESLEDINDQQEIFRDQESDVWKIFFKWLELYRSRDLLIDKWNDCKTIDDNQLDQLVLSFPPPKVITTEAEKLTAIEKRKALGLNTKVELLMLDDPALDEKTALAKLGKLIEEKQKALEDARKMMNTVGGPTPPPPGKNKPEEKPGLIENESEESKSNRVEG